MRILEGVRPESLSRCLYCVYCRDVPLLLGGFLQCLSSPKWTHFFLECYFFPPHPADKRKCPSASLCWVLYALQEVLSARTQDHLIQARSLTVSYLVHRKHSCFIVVTHCSGTACQAKSPLLKLIHPAALLLPFVFFIWSEISVYSGLKCRGYIPGLLVVMVLTASRLPLFRNPWMVTFFFFPPYF